MNPVKFITENNEVNMTLRDYFATKAMQGLLAAQSDEWNIYDHYHEMADEAYRIADEMLIARNAPPAYSQT